MTEITEDRPAWVGDDGQIIEPDFCSEYLVYHPMRCVRGRLCTVDGMIEDENLLKRHIYEGISPWVKKGIAKKVESIFNALKLACSSDPPARQECKIHFANGTYSVLDGFTWKKEFCLNRLSVNYNPQAPEPAAWKKFLSELLEAEDILTLQEYLGYCLLPTTKAQKMMIIIGKGGEGKSRIGVVLSSIYGDAMNTSSIQKVQTSRFARADLEGKLLMVDDDLDLSALEKTNYIKAIVTSECRMDVERKGIQSYQSLLYVRFLCFGNGALTSLHDRSDGFYRRQIIIRTKDKPANREDDPYLAERLIKEKEGIVLWCIEGLLRLLNNDFRFTISEQTKENISNVIREADNVYDFLKSSGYIRLKADYEASTAKLYEAYKLWCGDNAETVLSPKAFANHLAKQASRFRLEDTDNIYAGNGRRCRGYVGIEVLMSLY